MCSNAGTFSLNSSCAPGATKLEVSNQEMFVVLEVDGTIGLVVGMQSKQTQEVLSGELRLALGGILVNNEKMIVQVKSILGYFAFISIIYHASCFVDNLIHFSSTCFIYSLCLCFI